MAPGLLGRGISRVRSDPRPSSRPLIAVAGTRSENGVALLAALSFLILMALIAGGLLLSLNSDHRLVQQSLGEDQALNVAEAGVAEAMERIRTGEIPNSPNPRMVGQILLCSARELPDVGADSVALATWQNPGSWLTYSTIGPGPEALTVRYKTDAARTRIYRFDDTRNPTIQTAGGAPIFVVTSTGRDGDNHKTVVTEVVRTNVRIHDVDVWAAVVSGGEVHLNANTYVCGYDHRPETPDWTGLDGRTGEPRSCNEDPSTSKWEHGPAVEDRYGVWAAGAVNPREGGQYGEPQAVAENQPQFYSGCWQALGISESEFFSMLGPASRNTKARTLQGLTHFRGTTWLDRCDGEGLLYVEGDLHLGQEFTFRGLVYATGRIVVDGPCWVLGAMAAGGDFTSSGQGRCAVLYSRETIENAVSRYAARFVRLSWRES